MNLRSRTPSLALLLVIAVTSAFAQPPDADPIDPFACDLPELGRVHGELTPTGGWREGFGHEVHPVGDVDRDGLADWVVARWRVDTTVANRHPEEVLLYRGVRGGLPAVGSGQRIGPIEVGSFTRFLASGDWDADGNRDVAIRVQVIGDTSGGNSRGYEVATVAIFWGRGDGEFSIHDSTRLSCHAEMWLGVYGLNTHGASDLDGDGVDDLLLTTSRYGLSGGSLDPVPHLYVFRGGRDVRSVWTAGLSWWKPPAFNHVRAIDADVDGAVDLALMRNEDGIGLSGGISVLYGKRGTLPDTTNMQALSFSAIEGKVSQFVDLTGDRVPELVVAVGHRSSGLILSCRVYLGLPGQRIVEQYGSGDDPSRPGHATNWWGKPWAEVWSPYQVNPGANPIRFALWDLGDAGRDGVDDLWAFSWPHLIAYNGGLFLDSLVDALVFVPNPNSFNNVVANLGDIDGSGVETIAIGYSGREIDLPRFGGGVLFVKPDSCVPDFALWRMLPPGTDRPPAAVPHESLAVNALALSLDREGESHILRWTAGTPRAATQITLHDMLGRELWRSVVAASSSHVVIPLADLPRGTYLVAARRGIQHSSLVLTLP